MFCALFLTAPLSNFGTCNLHVAEVTVSWERVK